MMPKKNHKKSMVIFLRAVVKLDKKTTFAWLKYFIDSMKDTELFSKLDALGKKILFISGDEDHCFLKGSELLAKRIKMAEIAIINHCGHVCSIEKASIFNALSLNYLTAE